MQDSESFYTRTPLSRHPNYALACLKLCLLLSIFPFARYLEHAC